MATPTLSIPGETPGTLESPTQSVPAEITLLLRELEKSADDVPLDLWREALCEPVREILCRPGKQFRRQLTELAWRLSGAILPMPAGLPFVVELLHTGSLVIDDIEDGSNERRGRPALHRLVGTPVALNTGNWLYFRALNLLSTLHLPMQAELQCHRLAQAMIQDCHHGQALDLTAQVTLLSEQELPRVALAISRGKAGALMALAAGLGAHAAEAPPEQTKALIQFGYDLGIGLQMQNDWCELRGSTTINRAFEDLRLARVTWPWAWLAETATPLKVRALQRQLADLGEQSCQPADLAQTLRDELAEIAPQRIHEWLGQAFIRLQQVLGNSAVLDDLRRTIDRLEHRYG